MTTTKPKWEERVQIDHPAFQGDEKRKHILRAMYFMSDSADVMPWIKGRTKYRFVLDHGAYKGHSCFEVRYQAITPMTIIDLRRSFGFSVSSKIEDLVMEEYCNGNS